MEEKSAPASPEILTSDVYRETFLCMLPPEEIAALRIYGSVIESRLLDCSTFHEPSASFTEAEVRGALADLRFLAEFLRGVGREREASELSQRDWQISHAAAAVAEALAMLAERLEAELARLVVPEKNGL